MVLTNSTNGVLTVAEEFDQDPAYLIKTSAREAALADVFKVHDYNYLMKVIKISKKLKLLGDSS